jgi:integrase
LFYTPFLCFALFCKVEIYTVYASFLHYITTKLRYRRNMATFRKTDSGKWQAQVARGGKRVAKSFYTKIEAKDWAAQQEYEIRDAPNTNKVQGTVADVMLRYERDISRNKGGARWEALQIKRLLKMPLGMLNLADVSKSDIKAWRDSRLKSVQGATVNREFTLVSNIFNVAWHEWELIDFNPCVGVKRPKDNPPRDRVISKNEIEQVCLVAGFNDEPVNSIAQRVGVAFLFAIETAMRAGEICGLTWDCVDVEARTAHLPKTKNESSRDVALSSRAVELLGFLPKCENCFNLTSRQLDVNWRKLRDKTIIEDLHFHDTRHEATRRLSRKMGVLPLARMIGHKDLKMLQVYYNETASEIAKLLD